MRKHATCLLALAALALFVAGCASQPGVVEESADEPDVVPVAEFGESWSAATVELDVEDADIDDSLARVGFACEWTDGQKAGVAYPQEFVRADSGETVALDFEWDSGGSIPAGVYDVRVELDNVVGEGWVRDLDLARGTSTDVTVDLNAAQLAVPLDEVRSVKVFPAGTCDDYEARNMLDSVPEDLELTRYDEYHRKAIAPSGTFDLQVTYADDTTEWLTDYEIPANARVVEL